MKRIIIVLLIYFFLPSFCFAIDNKTWKKDLIMGSFDKTSRSDRKRIAEGLLKEIQKLNAYIPALKPSEAEWLDKEFKSSLSNLSSDLSSDAFVQKLASLPWTPEWRIRHIKDDLQKIIESLECVLTDTISNQREIYCWAKVNHILTDSSSFNSSIRILHSKSKVDFSGKVKKQFFLSESDEEPWALYNQLGRSIQENIVLFMLTK